MNHYYFIVLEGVDGTGKTSICEKVAKEIDAIVYRTPPFPFNRIRLEIDKNTTPKTRFLFYLSGVLHASDEIKKIIKYSHVICDRYFYSTLSYHYVLDPSMKVLDISTFNLLLPTFVFYLKASYVECIKRISQRDNKNMDDIINDRFNSKEFILKVDKEFSNFNNMIPLDTEKLNIEECTTRIIHTIGYKSR